MPMMVNYDKNLIGKSVVKFPAINCRCCPT